MKWALCYVLEWLFHLEVICGKSSVRCQLPACLFLAEGEALIPTFVLLSREREHRLVTIMITTNLIGNFWERCAKCDDGKATLDIVCFSFSKVNNMKCFCRFSIVFDKPIDQLRIFLREIKPSYCRFVPKTGLYAIVVSFVTFLGLVEEVYI